VIPNPCAFGLNAFHTDLGRLPTSLLIFTPEDFKQQRRQTVMELLQLDMERRLSKRLSVATQKYAWAWAWAPLFRLSHF